MKKPLLIAGLLLACVAVITCFVFKFSYDYLGTDNIAIKKLRKKHQYHIENSPFKETNGLTRKERKKLGLPPNAYNEQMWELTLDPNTGRPMPERVLKVQEQLKKQRAFQKGGGGDSANPWVDRGPNNIGGRTRGIMFDPNDADKNRVFAGGVSGGLWVNEDITDVNSSWTLIPGIGANISVTAIIYDPNNTNTFYIGSGESYTSGDAVGRGVWKSTDGGVTWANIFGGYTGFSGSSVQGIFYINDIVARDMGTTTELYIAVANSSYRYASNPGNILGSADRGIYKSTDAGANWVKNALNQASPNDLEIDLNNDIWLSTTNGRIYKSTDGINFNLKVTIPNASRTEIAVSSLNVNKLWVATNSGGEGANLWFTDDAFATFDAVANRLPEPNDADTGIPETDYTRGQAFYDLPIEVDVSDNLYVGGIDLFRSSDGGTTWAQISKWSNNNNLANLDVPRVHADQHAIVFRPGAPTEAVFGNDGGIYYSPDITAPVAPTSTLSITSRNKDYNVTQFYYGAIAPGTSNEIITGGTQDNGTLSSINSVAGANSFTSVRGGDGAFTAIDQDGISVPTRGEYMIQSYVYLKHRLAETSNNNKRYTIIDTNEGNFINQAELDDVGNILYANSSSGGTNQFSSFVLGQSSATRLDYTNALLNAQPSAFKVSPYTNTTLYVGTRNSKLLKITGLVGSPAWTDISGPSFIGSISDIELGTTAQEIFVTVHNYGVNSIWYTADGGANWVSKEGNLPDIPVKCILQNPLALEEVIIGTALGVWRTADIFAASPVWTQSFNGMSDVSVVDLDLRASDKKILATTHGRGLFTSKFSRNDFEITINNGSSRLVCPPDDITYNFTYNTFLGFSGTTTFSAVGLPAGAIANFNTASTSTDGTIVTLTISGTNTLAVGDYNFQIQGTSGAITRAVNADFKILALTLNVPSLTAPADAAIELSDTPTLNWVANSYALSYDYQVATDSGFTNIVQSGNATNVSVTLSLLDLATTYFWRVRSKNTCTSGSYSTTFSFTTTTQCTVCTSAGNTNWQTSTTRVLFNTIDNASAKPSGYSDYTFISTQVERNQSHNLSVQVNTEGNYTVNTVVWIDWNKDCVFDDAPEKYDLGTAQNKANGITTGSPLSITVPNNAVFGTTTMRVSTKFGNTDATSCENGADAEVEDYSITVSPTLVSWTGTVNTDWATAGNWDTGAVPTASTDIIIPNVTFKPTISTGTTAVANNITIEASSSLIIAAGGTLTSEGNITQNGTFIINSNATLNGSLIVKGTATGAVNYQRHVSTAATAEKGWYLLSAPVNGTSIANFYESVVQSGTKRGIAPYVNTNAATFRWAHYTTADTPGNFVKGKGYAIKKLTAGELAFNGALNTDNAGVSISLEATGDQYNAIGNPYTSYINSGTFLDNIVSGRLTEKTIWLWDESGNLGAGEYITKNITDAYKIAPGQGFFVKALANGDVIFPEAIQTHEGGDSFLKQESRPEIKLSMSDGTNLKSTKILYIENKTTGFDDGFDSSMFEGASNPFAVYTQLVAENENKNIAIQTLPDSNYESMSIPIGVKAGSGLEITFTVDALNLPTDINVFLEDRVANTITRLDEENTVYRVTLTEALNGVGRFFLHTSSQILAVSNVDLVSVSIYSSDKKIHLSGLPNGVSKITLYNVLGKVVLKESTAKNRTSIPVKNLSKGAVYIVKLITEKGVMSKKIIIE